MGWHGLERYSYDITVYSSFRLRPRGQRLFTHAWVQTVRIPCPYTLPMKRVQLGLLHQVVVPGWRKPFKTLSLQDLQLCSSLPCTSVKSQVLFNCFSRLFAPILMQFPEDRKGPERAISLHSSPLSASFWAGLTVRKRRQVL